MSSETLLSRLLANRQLDVDAAKLGLLVAILLFPLRFLASQIFIETLPIVLGVASILYLLAARGPRTDQQLPRLPGWFARLAPSLVFLGTALMVVIATLAGERSVLFYDVAGATGTLLLLQILFTADEDLHPPLVLVEVLVVTLVVRFAALYTTPGFIGIDIWTHVPDYAASIAAEHSLAPISNHKHYASPLYHLLVVTSAQILDLSLRNALYLTLGVAMPFGALFVYLLLSLSVSRRWALFGAAVYAGSDYFIEWGIHLIPTSMGLLFFLAVLYALSRFLELQYGLRDLAMLLFFTTAVVLTHQISSFIMLVVIGGGLLAQLLFRLGTFEIPDDRYGLFSSSSDPANLTGILVFDVGLMTFMWSLTPYHGRSFLETVLIYLRMTLLESAGFLNLAGGTQSASSGAGGGGGPTLVELLATYVDTLGFLLLLFATVVGSFYVLRRNRVTHAMVTHVVSVVVMLVFVLGLPLFGVRSFIPGRWFAFLYAPMVVLGVVGLRHLATNLRKPVAVAVLVLFVLLVPGVMVSSSNGAIDNPVFPNRVDYAYDQTELAAVDTVGEYSPPETQVKSSMNRTQAFYTDHPYQTVFSRTFSRHSHPAKVVAGQQVTAPTTVYRKYQTDHGAYFLNENDQGRLTKVQPARLCGDDRNRVYANGDVSVCRLRGRTDSTVAFVSGTVSDCFTGHQPAVRGFRISASKSV
ncbi:hypothetical protein ACFQH6_07605 [Halobacteriaceae archaeon GCM10025711]